MGATAVSSSSPPQHLPIGEMARRCGVATSALRFYEERGLIAAERLNGRRHFHRSVIRRVAFITFAQRVGLTLDEIKVELDRLPAGRVPDRGDWSRLTKTWRTRIDERIAELERLRDSLDDCIGCGCLSLARCKLSNPDDRAGARGAGPRAWMGEPGPWT